MTLAVLAAVLFSALLHASWNAALRFAGDRVAMITVIAAFSACVALPGLFVVTPPRPESWPWMFASVVLHVGYSLFLAAAYTHGELGKVYPLARGTAPLLALLGSFLVVSEPLAASTVAGIVTLGLGIFALTLDRGLTVLMEAPRGALYALATSVFVAGYTISDGMGARAAADPHAYALWLFVLDGVPLVVIALVVRGRAATAAMFTGNWRLGLPLGAMALAAYWIAIWAMTVAPIALVAALRETSVIFAVLIGVTVLGERLTWPRAVAVTVVLLGLVLMRL